MAIDAAHQEGVNRTAQQLHLDARKFKTPRLVLVAADAGQHKEIKGRRQPGFLELVAPAPTANPPILGAYRVRIRRREQNAHPSEDGRSAVLEARCAAQNRACFLWT